MKGIVFIMVLIGFVLSGCVSGPTEPVYRQANIYQFENKWTADTPENNAEKQYSVATWVYSIVADRTYLEDETLCLPLDEQWLEIMVADKEFQKLQSNGFYAQAWHRTSGTKRELIIAYRGTDGSGDFMNANFRFFSTKNDDSQYTSALKYRDLVLQVANGDSNLEYDEVVFVGHSLGGGLAQFAQDFTDDSQIPTIAYSFNGSPNRGRLLSIWENHLSVRRATRVYEKGEVLRPLRWMLFDFDPYNNNNPGGKGMNTIWIDFYEDDLVDNHNMKDLSTALTRLAAISGDSQASAVMDSLRKRRQDSLELYPKQCSINGTEKVM